jgi:putative tryptophan/tyrosine transport system substrate-binding protein
MGTRQEATRVRSGRMVLLVALALGLLWAPLAAHAQQPGNVPRIGVLSTGSPPATLPRFEPFIQRLHELGYVEGQTIALEYRFADGKHERLPGLAAELIDLNVDVIVTSGTPAAVAAKHATSMIPIIIAIAADPVGEGLVASLAWPGGNVTGMANLDTELSGKRLEILKEVIPGLSRVAILWNPANPAHRAALGENEVAARALGVQLQPVEARAPHEFTSAFSAMSRERASALMLLADSMFGSHRAQVVELAAKSRLPSLFWVKDFVAAGGLMSYGASYPDLLRRAATYVDKILKGAKPADLPMEQPTKFELVINLKTAQALGLTIPPTLLFQADEVLR